MTSLLAKDFATLPADFARILQEETDEDKLLPCGLALENLGSEECLKGINTIIDDEVDLLVGDERVASTESDAIWLILAGVLVFFMHAGFAMLEAGSVRKPSVINIMFKNIGTVAIGAVSYWLLGFGFGYGNFGDNTNSFIGSSSFAYDFDSTGELDQAAFFFFQYTFAATAATIVSGAVAERITLGAYFIAASVITGVIFPIVTHWVWSDAGFISAFSGGAGELVEGSIGLIDFAGSAVVHATGGMIAMCAAKIVGPRTGRFAGGRVNPMPPSSYTLQTLGTFILWFGWYGFNCGSTLIFDGTNSAKAAVTTTLAPSAAAVVATFYSKLVRGRYDLSLVLNSVLAGLVSITAGCVAVADYAALIIGAIGMLVYVGSSNLLLYLKIDDPIGAAPVHGFCGIWGVIAVGIFLDDDAIADSYGVSGVDQGAQFAMQLTGAIIITLWALVWGVTLFSGLKVIRILRISEQVEKAGIDASEHGGAQALHF